MGKKTLLLFLLPWVLFTRPITIEDRQAISKLAGSMLMVGFFGTEAGPNSRICRDIQRYHLGGVILFDRDPTDAKRAKNIRSKGQLRHLTRQLQDCSVDGKLLIAVDQEGGVVQRLKKRYGFIGNFPRPANVARKGEAYARKVYGRMAKELASIGINYDLAPVVDLAINPKNQVIVGWGRSFGKSPRTVTKYASIFIEEMHKHGVLTSLKHFPGHGSSTGDTHKGFVDVSQQWREVELKPYEALIRRGLTDTIMVAHLFNRNFDPRYPASLSRRTVTGLLRKRMGYHGVVITDDLQMGAIAKHYSLDETIRLSIMAGNDLLLFGNQLDPKHIYSPKVLVDRIVRMVEQGTIPLKRIIESRQRIERLKQRL